MCCDKADINNPSLDQTQTYSNPRESKTIDFEIQMGLFNFFLGSWSMSINLLICSCTLTPMAKVSNS